MWNKTERNGNVDEAKGKIKQAAGTLTGNSKLKAEGRVDQAVGKAEVAVGGISHKANDAAARVGKAAKR
jgi:uncharacterized protein YjbJ (UPF0337 family)